MTEQEKEEKAKAEAEAAELKALEGLSDEEKAQAEEEAKRQHNTDIEEALKEERKKREEAERKLEETRQKAKERIEKKRQEEEFEGGETPITLKDIKSIFEEERDLIRKETREERAKDIAGNLSESEAETNLILEVWKNRTLVGSLEEQIKEAHAIATYSQTKKMNSELKRSLEGKGGVSKENLNAQRKPDEGGEPKIDPLNKTVLTGYVWDKAKQAYKKTIAGGKKIFYVSKDLKKRWTENA